VRRVVAPCHVRTPRERKAPREEAIVERRVRCECGHEVPLPAGEAAARATCPACGGEIPSESPPASSDPPLASAMPETKPCPFCLEPIHPAARKCPHCQEYLDSAVAAEKSPRPPPSALALVSLIVGIVSPCLLGAPGPLAIVLGVLALVRDRKATGKPMAIAGIVLGVLWTALLVLLVLWIAGWGGLGGHGTRPYTPPDAEPIF